MDAIEFFKAMKRMCGRYDAAHCEECPLEDHACGLTVSKTFAELKAMIELVEKWAAEHPAKTRQSELLKLFPEAKMDDEGVCKVCPAYVRLGDCDHDCPSPDTNCYDCRRKFWLEEVE